MTSGKHLTARVGLGTPGRTARTHLRDGTEQPHLRSSFTAAAISYHLAVSDDPHSSPGRDPNIRRSVMFCPTKTPRTSGCPVMFRSIRNTRTAFSHHKPGSQCPSRTRNTGFGERGPGKSIVNRNPDLKTPDVGGFQIPNMGKYGGKSHEVKPRSDIPRSSR